MFDDFSIIDLVNPELYIFLGGLWLVLFIIFAETGIFVGFFFPGDSLLFVSGIYATDLIQDKMDVADQWTIWWLIGLTALSAILGNILGYFIGMKSQSFFYNAQDRWYYKKKYLNQAHDFYEKHGGFALTFARFVPIIRTFVPVVAGIVDMRFSAFLMYTVVGGIIWPLLLQASGFYLYAFFLHQFEVDIKDYIQFIVFGIIIVSVGPIVYNFIFGKRKD